jgi:hypothetical protein
MPKGIYLHIPHSGTFKKGQKFSLEHLKHLSESHKGYIMPESQKKKISKSHKGLNTWMKGKKDTNETRLKKSLAHIGFKHTEKSKKLMKDISKKDAESPNYKGENAGYFAKHKWVTLWKGQPSLCEMCGTIKAKKFEWANIDHKYRRVLEDYIRMCTSCHLHYDNERRKKAMEEDKAKFI